MTRMTSHTTRTMGALVAALLFALLSTDASAQTPTADQKAEFSKLVQQRNRLTTRLYELDDQASALIKKGKDPIVVHAEQVSVQDQIDLAELRMAIIATRYGMAIPPAPSRKPAKSLGGAETGNDPRIDQAFSRGRNRALARIREDGLRMLASIDFSTFLAE